MINTTFQLKIILVSYLNNIVVFLDPFLKNLDPSLFQNIILGILAIFIPFAIVFLTDILNSKNEKRSEFEKMVLNDEVFGTIKIFWLSVISIVFFSFFSGTNISSSAKIISIVAIIILIFLFSKPFRKILRFSDGNKIEFEISFLNKLSLSKFFIFKSKSRTEKILRAWNSFWSEKSEFNEKDFTKIFISHIDDAINLGQFDTAVQLAQIYINNIEKRNSFSVGYEILPKVFEWNEILWKEQEIWIKSYDMEKKIQNNISEKHFPVFRVWILKLYKKFNSKRDRFWNWHYFGGEFFQSTIKVLLKDGHGPYQLFTSFKKHINECENKLDKIENSEEKEKYWQYITGLFTSFCPSFFNEIENAPAKYDIWQHNLPPEWKISMSNIENRIPGVILHEFLQWSGGRFFKNEKIENSDKDLSEVINGIFPNIHSSLFKNFLMLFSSNEIKYILDKEPNFYIKGTSVSWSGSIEDQEEDRDKRILEMLNKKEISQKEETIQIIFTYFHFWQTLIIYKDNLTEDESKDWDSYDEEQKKIIVKRVRKNKLEKIKIELNNIKIKKTPKVSDGKEQRKKGFLELIDLLIKQNEK